MEKYLDLFAFIDLLSQQIGTKAYLWGGWIPDVYSDKVLREHDDAEHLIIDLYDHIDKLQKVFDILDWETKILENGDLKVIKEDVKVHFGHLEIKNDKAEWFHNGSLGKIIFPKEWLNNAELLFQGRRIHAVSPEFQYILKLHPEYMNPDWQHREKDRADLEVLKQLLRDEDIKSLEKLMRSV